jgi:hypothetical protein
VDDSIFYNYGKDLDKHHRLQSLYYMLKELWTKNIKYEKKFFASRCIEIQKDQKKIGVLLNPKFLYKLKSVYYKTILNTTFNIRIPMKIAVLNKKVNFRECDTLFWTSSFHTQVLLTNILLSKHK